MARRSIAKPVHVIVDTPRDSRNKFKFDPQLQRFRLGRVLPVGVSFPYDFGYVPDTAAEDGDPLDVLLLMDAPAFAGCLVGWVSHRRLGSGTRRRRRRRSK